MPTTSVESLSQRGGGDGVGTVTAGTGSRSGNDGTDALSGLNARLQRISPGLNVVPEGPGASSKYVEYGSILEQVMSIFFSRSSARPKFSAQNRDSTTVNVERQAPLIPAPRLRTAASSSRRSKRNKHSGPRRRPRRRRGASAPSSETLR